MRPPLSSQTSLEDFNSWYWLKAELQAFCRQNGIPASGSKEDLLARARAFLRGDAVEAPKPIRRKRDVMPALLTIDTVIGAGWTLNADLRAFFIGQLGTGFRFDQTLRDLFRNPEGRTLGDAVALYRNARAQPSSEIARQFQFNRHIRDYFAANPQGTRAEAVRLWQERRQLPGAIPHSDSTDE